MVTVIIGYINYTTESVPPSPSSKSVWACRITQLKQFLTVISNTHSNFLPNKNEKGQLEMCEKTNTCPKLLRLAPFKTKAKALECPFFLLYRKHSLQDSALPCTALAAHRKVKSSIVCFTNTQQKQVCNTLQNTLAHPISRGMLIQVETANFFTRVNDKAELSCSTASNPHCILGDAQEPGIPTANSESAAGFCKRALVVFPLMNSKCCSFRNRVKKCLPNCPFNGRRNILLLQQQTVPSCHPHTAERANLCY